MTWVLSDAELDLEAWLRSRDVGFRRETATRSGFTTVTLDESAAGRGFLPILGSTPLAALTAAVDHVKYREKQAAEDAGEAASLDNWLIANAQSHSTSLSSGTGPYTVSVVVGWGLPSHECVGPTLLQALRNAVDHVRSVRRSAGVGERPDDTAQAESAAPSSETFDVGDVVQLKSGGARMTVTSVRPDDIVGVALVASAGMSQHLLPVGALRRSAVAEELRPGAAYRSLGGFELATVDRLRQVEEATRGPKLECHVDSDFEERIRQSVRTGMQEARERAKGARDFDSFERVPAPDSLSSTAMARAVAALTDGGRELTLSRNGGVWHAKSSLGRASYLRDGRNLTEVLQDLVRDTGVSLG